ncbi:hypothetical protein KIH07_17260 [Hydrogenophaga taeniospiralis]|uniref:hypothetical protein n=1 Tax=Hydrogenophaga taeniospiralis TaxID=65656 RepID=UPI001CFA9818|nr:hypothetical protein [Hydrogenophaga taeniospiralis]MCB4365493.1 hypothetical protein [Hydrogenophaga taeniospiralis]
MHAHFFVFSILPSSYHQMRIQSFFSVLAACAALAACSAKTEEQVGTGSQPKTAAKASGVEDNLLTDAQMDALRQSRTVAVVFKAAAGSSGSGEVMKELKALGGPLREPNLDYDVYDPQSNLGPKELKQEIASSLDRDRQVLVDNGGTPESRALAADIVFETTGGAIPDAAGTIIRKAPEDKGGGYMLIPIYSKADVEAQVTQGLIPNAAEQTNSIENFFFEPAGK